ncbi:MAG: two component, sigma54 specific, transcriptional regulator, Fis family [Phycisphaerales bacterium]|nr:two component, sigma54 specific, transcriptional regulator, Fis family [Phycisphaerales bacterium]
MSHTGPADRAARPRIIGNSAAVRRMCRQIIALGPRRCTVLLHGETGTGKELVARLVHIRSIRSAGPFVPVDCTTLRDTLFESQLFGHMRGAFTGADRPTLGFFRAADGGTLFLDEIGELPLSAQAKLLRCIQEGAVTPLGATAGIAADVRVIAATHRDLAAMVKSGAFREDLYYRLNVARLRLPPLRERHGDIPLLVRHALMDFARFYEEPVRSVTEQAMAALVSHDWPGNVRELLNAIEHAVVFAPFNGPLRHVDLPAEVLGVGDGSETSAPFRTPLTLDAVERSTIMAALQASGGNQSRAALSLAIERHRLRRRIVHHGLTHLVRPQA